MLCCIYKYSAIHGVDPENIDRPDVEIAEFILFAEKAKQLIGCPVLPLITAAKGFENFIPPQITRIYGRQYSLKVSVICRALQRTKISYRVDSFSPFLCTSESTSTSKQIEKKTGTLDSDDCVMPEYGTSTRATSTMINTQPTTLPSIGSVPDKSLDISKHDEHPDSSKKDIQLESPTTLMSTSASFINVVPAILTSEKENATSPTVGIEKTPPSPHTMPTPGYTPKKTSSLTHSDLPVSQTDTSTSSKKTSVKRKLFTNE